VKRHVALVGFMAAGKSTIGRKLARRLGCAFFDTDTLIAHEHGTVASIFEHEGEAAFRGYERATLSDLFARGETGVVALGGGAVTDPQTRALLEDRAHRIFLKVSPEQVFNRLQHSREVRPLLGRDATLERIRELYHARIPLYARADFTVHAERRSAHEILDDILQWLNENRIRLSP